MKFCFLNWKIKNIYFLFYFNLFSIKVDIQRPGSSFTFETSCCRQVPGHMPVLTSNLHLKLVVSGEFSGRLLYLLSFSTYTLVSKPTICTGGPSPSDRKLFKSEHGIHLFVNEYSLIISENVSLNLSLVN